MVLGKVRAKQDQRGDTERSQVMALLLHGDAAFAGQGLVAETLDLSDLKGYRIGGTIHFIINNQIGFTTNPVQSRSGPYCSEVAKIVQAPIFHVNGDDPEAVVHVARIATEFRQQFKKDVVIDMFCYRRFGHNEGDEPAFTQPLMYRTIAKHPTTARDLCRAADRGRHRRRRRGATAWRPSSSDRLEREFEAATSYKPNKADWLEGAWAGLAIASGDDRRGRDRRAARDAAAQSARRSPQLPPGLPPQPQDRPRSSRPSARRSKPGEGIDWATGEALAFGTLLAEGVPVRLSGQDSGPRHLLPAPCGAGRPGDRGALRPAEQHPPGQARVEVIDSPLSEAGVLGFEYGYSLAEPQGAGDLGGAVRRFRQRRPGHHRPVHHLRREQVAAHVGPGDAAAARL